jgi:hypothetical protein
MPKPEEAEPQNSQPSRPDQLNWKEEHEKCKREKYIEWGIQSGMAFDRISNIMSGGML